MMTVTRASTWRGWCAAWARGPSWWRSSARCCRRPGLYKASEFVLIPRLLTLVILGLVLALQRFSADVYGAITGQGAAAREALMPIFFGLVLLLLALPLLALAWGARVSDLTEVWAAFRRGFAIGDSRDLANRLS